MRITDLLDRKSIDLNAAPRNKKEALDQVIDLMLKSDKVTDIEAYRKQVYAREEEGTTGIGDGLAIPHGRCGAVAKPGLAAMVVKDGVDFQALDDEPVNLIFLIAAPETKDNIHLTVLAKLSGLLMHEDFVAALLNAPDVDTFLKLIDEADEKYNQENEVDLTTAEKGRKKLIAVTSCPAGIAHTYMAAEALEKAGKAAGHAIKVETRGAGGAGNVVTDREIEEADAVIIAADALVPMDRFDGKKLIQVPVSAGISKADQLIKQALSDDAPIFHAANAGEEKESVSSNSGSIVHQLYVQLMNGVSHMLPFVVGGGILIAFALLIDSFAVDINTLADKSTFGSVTPAAATLKSIGRLAFGFMLPVLAGYIAEAIADRPGLAVGFVGGMIASGGKSGFLGALLAGFLAGYIVKFLMKLAEKLPKSIEKIAPILLYPLLGILIIALIMTFLVEQPVGWLNTALNTGLTNMGGSSRLLLGAILGGMMAIDMGGPINKAACVFGTASIAAGNYYIMAACMIGGMVPPIAIAFATLLFKKKFTKEQRKSAPVNIIMGLAFITEGAIPFVAADPVHVLPACIAGSAVGGMMSMVFNCTLMAPHGGIFVFPVVGNAHLYLLALLIGSVVGTILLGVFKKDIAE